jgi:hypothetical protein
MPIARVVAQAALAVQSSSRVASDAYSRTLEARLAAQETENQAQRQLSTALHAKINVLEQQLAGELWVDGLVGGWVGG